MKANVIEVKPFCCRPFEDTPQQDTFVSLEVDDA